ncbi:MAG: hypothetical protein R2698_00540 [Microthrixaceae bacterium]
MQNPRRGTDHLRWTPLWRGAATMAVIAVPVALGQMFLLDSDEITPSSGVNLLLDLAILFSAAAGGYAAATFADRLRLQHGAAASGLAAAVIQVVGGVRRAVAGEEVSHPLGWILLVLLCATCGMFGAWIHRKVTPPDEPDELSRDVRPDHERHGGSQRTGEATS